MESSSDRWLSHEISRRRFLYGSAAVGGLGLLAACGGRSGGDSGGSTTDTDYIALAEKEEFPQKLIDAAKKEPSGLTIYTSDALDYVKKTLGQFQDQFGIKVEYYRATAADVAIRATKEFKANKLAADVIDASSIASFLAMDQLGMLDAFRPPRTSKLAQKDLIADDNTWIADRIGISVITWNTNVVDSPPKSWHDLTDPKWKGKLATWMTAAGSEIPWLFGIADKLGYDFLKQIAANDPLLVNSQPTLSATVAKGDRPVGFSIGDNYIWTQKETVSNIDFLIPSDVAVNVSGAVGKVKKSKRPAGALLLINWWLSKQAQELQATYGKYSTFTDIAPPKGDPELSSLKLVSIDTKKLAANRTDIVNKIHGIFGFAG